jgi:hypothetical protein
MPTTDAEIDRERALNSRKYRKWLKMQQLSRSRRQKELDKWNRTRLGIAAHIDAEFNETIKGGGGGGSGANATTDAAVAEAKRHSLVNWVKESLPRPQTMMLRTASRGRRKGAGNNKDGSKSKSRRGQSREGVSGLPPAEGNENSISAAGGGFGVGSKPVTRAGTSKSVGFDLSDSMGNLQGTSMNHNSSSVPNSARINSSRDNYNGISINSEAWPADMYKHLEGSANANANTQPPQPTNKQQTMTSTHKITNTHDIHSNTVSNNAATSMWISGPRSHGVYANVPFHLDSPTKVPMLTLPTEPDDEDLLAFHKSPENKGGMQGKQNDEYNAEHDYEQFEAAIGVQRNTNQSQKEGVSSPNSWKSASVSTKHTNPTLKGVWTAGFSTHSKYNIHGKGYHSNQDDESTNNSSSTAAATATAAASASATESGATTNPPHPSPPRHPHPHPDQLPQQRPQPVQPPPQLPQQQQQLVVAASPSPRSRAAGQRNNNAVEEEESKQNSSGAFNIRGQRESIKGNTSPVRGVTYIDGNAPNKKILQQSYNQRHVSFSGPELDFR